MGVAKISNWEMESVGLYGKEKINGSLERRVEAKEPPLAAGALSPISPGLNFFCPTGGVKSLDFLKISS